MANDPKGNSHEQRGGPAEQAVRPGDHLGRIAAAWGFRSYGPLWNDEKNAAVRAKRHNPNILAVGEPIYIPELNLRAVDRATEQRHRFRAELHPPHLDLRLSHWDGTPMAAADEVKLDGKLVPFQNGANGQVRVEVTNTSDRCAVKIGKEEIVLRIGFLQSIDTVDGVRERLNNLGYEAGEASDPEKLDFRSAVEEFQCDHGLVVDGKVGPATRAKLVAVHGC